MDSLKLNRNGFTIVSVLVATGIILTTFLGVISYLIFEAYTAKDDSKKAKLYDLRANIIANIKSDTAWANTVKDSGNGSMACLRDSTDCSSIPLSSIIVRDNLDAVLVAKSAMAGFSWIGETCNSFNGTSGNDACPVKVTIQWKPICSAGDCKLAQVKGSFKVKPAKSSRINPEQYDFELLRPLSGGAVSCRSLASANLWGSSQSAVIKGDFAIIGNPPDPGWTGVYRGKAVVFKKDAGGNWNELQLLNDASSTYNVSPWLQTDGFGVSVAIDGNWLAVGAYLESSSVDRGGAVYIYQWNGTAWTFVSKIKPTDTHAVQTFGNYVSISGSWMFIGAARDQATGSEAGAAYVYRFNGSNWIFSQKLQPSNSMDHFADKVVVNGTLAAASATGYSSDSNNSYVQTYNFNGTSWVANTFIPGDTKTGFGQSLALSGNNLLIGKVAGFDAAVRMFEYNGTAFVSQAFTGPSKDGFGAASALAKDNPDRMAVFADDNFTKQASYYYQRTAGTWVQKAIFSPEWSMMSLSVGYINNISIDGDSILVSPSGSPFICDISGL